MQTIDAVEQRLRQLGLPDDYIRKHVARLRQLRTYRCLRAGSCLPAHNQQP
jgi:hypothetical protein